MSVERVLVVILIVLLVGVLGGSGYGWYYFDQVVQNKTAAIASLNDELVSAKAESARLADSLLRAKSTNTTFSGTIDKLSNTVDTLQKLATTDPQLLKKYSKVYFLNENYVPKSLVAIDPDFLYDASSTDQILTQVEPFLTRMITSAASDGVSLKVISAYRSFGTQESLKASYRITYGSGANAFSADQGYSEHQLGTTVDLTTDGVGDTFVGFDKTPAYAWLTANAYRYGFVLSYPKNNTYYQFEPWHWRFVGTDLSAYLHAKGIYFYDADQNTINTYLSGLFDQPPWF